MMKNAFFNRYGFRILLVVFFLLPFIFMGTNRTFMSNSNNVADWLPDSFEETHQYQWFLKNFPFERFVLVSWQGCTMEDPRLEMFAQKLVPGQTIDNIGQWAEKHFSAELVLEGNVLDNNTPDNNAPTALPIPADSQPLQPDSSAAPQPKQVSYFKEVLTGPRLFRLLRDLYSSEGIGGVKLTDEEIQQKLQGILVGPDGKSTALLVTLTQEAPQGKELHLVLDAIKQIGIECNVQPEIQTDNRFFLTKVFDAVYITVKEMIYGRNPRMDGVILGGPPVDNVAITQEGEQTLKRLAGLCGLIGLSLAWLCFRDFRLTFFIFWMAIISAGVALASVSLTGSTCDAILLSMPALIYVLAMSGAIHLINYYHDAVREHGIDMAPERAVRHAWSPCFYANFTTALGLISLCMSGLIPINKFGFYSALGVMLQLVLLFYYLPTLLHFYPSHKIAAQGTLDIEKDSIMQKFWQFWCGLMIRYATPVTLACFIIMIFFGLGMLQIKTSVKMMRFFSSDSEIIHHYTWLEEHLGPLVPMEIVVEFDNKKLFEDSRMTTVNRLRLVEKICDALRTELKESVGGVLSAETMMPSPPQRRTGITAIVKNTGFNSKLDNGRSALKDYITIEGNISFSPKDNNRTKNLEEIGISSEDANRLFDAGIEDTKILLNVSDEIKRVGISSEEIQAFQEKASQWEKAHGTDLWRISLRVWSLKKDIDYALFIQEVKDVVEPIIAEANKELLLENSATENSSADKSVIDNPAIGNSDTEKSAIGAVYTGMVPVVYKTQHELLTGLRDSFVSSFVMIAITMSIILRNPLAGFLAMIPNLFPVLLVFGFMGRFGILVDVGTMMTASVALGISVDDTIHFLTWFRHGIDEGMSRHEATRFAYSRCASAMFQTTMIAGLGLSAFALSTFTPTQMFGIMMLAILLAAMIGDLIFLAAILNTPLGKVFEPKKKEK